jgi:MYXO-CTERM domain-containing protein
MARVNQSKKSVLCNRIALAAVAASICGVLVPSAHAIPVVTPVTFAHFEEAIPAGDNPNQFNYNTAGTAGSGGSAVLSASSVPVTFSYESITGLPADLQGPLAATLTLTTATTVGASQLFAGFGSEPFNSQTSDVLTINLDTPVNNGAGPQSNLLTMKFTGQLIGFLNGFAATLTGQTPNGASISYTSDFLNFGGSVEDYNLGFTSWVSSDFGGLEIPASGFYQNATAAGTGTFDDSSVTPVPTIPEPITSVFAASSLGALLLRRRRRTA